jgi:hypothetical protein
LFPTQTASPGLAPETYPAVDVAGRTFDDYMSGKDGTPSLGHCSSDADTARDELSPCILTEIAGRRECAR